MCKVLVFKIYSMDQLICISMKVFFLCLLEGTARYAGFLLAPAEGFGLQPRFFFFFFFLQKTVFKDVCAYYRPFMVISSNLPNFSSNLPNLSSNLSILDIIQKNLKKYNNKKIKQNLKFQNKITKIKESKKNSKKS